MASLPGCQSDKSEVDENKEGKDLGHRDKIRLKQYLIQGKRLYLANCSNCHQKDGTGLGKLIPPLKASDYLKEDVNRTICLTKYGISDTILVNGIAYNQKMPGNKEFTALDIAEVVTYVYNTWGDKNEIIDVNMVNQVLKGCNSSH